MEDRLDSPAPGRRAPWHEALGATRSLVGTALRPVVGVAKPVLRPAVNGALEVQRATSRRLLALSEDTAVAVVDAAVFAPSTEDLIGRTLDSPRFNELVDKILDSEGIKHLIAKVIASPLVDEVIQRLLESDDLWLLVDEIARSPSVTQAISSQGTSFAGQMVDVFRARSSVADDRIEQAARRLARRNPRVAAHAAHAGGDSPAAGAAPAAPESLPRAPEQPPSAPETLRPAEIPPAP
ncbi:MAG TPA: hypothetical protein VNR66_14765 [Solirubrobacteraceae bacterium]|nr:hypothetical protein [Solirubrobacteraceae bacterium]